MTDYTKRLENAVLLWGKTDPLTMKEAGELADLYEEVSNRQKLTGAPPAVIRSFLDEDTFPVQGYFSDATHAMVPRKLLYILEWPWGSGLLNRGMGVIDFVKVLKYAHENVTYLIVGKWSPQLNWGVYHPEDTDLAMDNFHTLEEAKAFCDFMGWAFHVA